MELSYGDSSIELDLDPGVEVVKLPQAQEIASSLDEIGQALQEMGQRLRASQPSRVAIVAEDKTRRNPELPLILSRLLKIIQASCNAEILLVPALGTHPPHSTQENQLCYGVSNLASVQIVDHDCRDLASLQPVGVLASGQTLQVNHQVASAGYLIVLGTVAPHAFAGFTGGRKGILPGVADYSSIRRNHAMVVRKEVGLGQLSGNPLHEDMQDALRLVKVNFAVQWVYSPGGKLAGIFAGDLPDTFDRAVACCRQVCSIETGQPADVLLVGCGGHPRDDSLYHGQRAVAVAAQAVKPGGLTVVFGRFPKGVGHPVFEHWLGRPARELLGLSPEEIDVGVHSALLLARNLSASETWFYTDMSTEQCQRSGLRRVPDPGWLQAQIRRRLGAGERVRVIPDGSRVLVNTGGA